MSKDSFLTKTARNIQRNAQCLFCKREKCSFKYYPELRDRFECDEDKKNKEKDHESSDN